MKWFSLVLVLLSLLAPIWGQFGEGPDYTSRYAQIASPVPAGVDAAEIVAQLTAFNNH